MKDVNAPSTAEVDDIVNGFVKTQRDYLGRFTKEELHSPYEGMEDDITTSQCAERKLSASLRNSISSVEPE